MLNQCADRDANGIHNNVAPLEGIAQYKADEFNTAKLVNPIGLVEFTDFDGIGDGKGRNYQMSCRS